MKNFFQTWKSIWVILTLIFFAVFLNVFFQNTTNHVTRLSDVVLSGEETGISQLPDYYEVNKTNEISEFCKIDCVSVSYISKMVTLSITIIKSQTSLEAKEVSQVFYNNIANIDSFKTRPKNLKTNYFEELFPSKDKTLPNQSTSLGITHKLSEDYFAYSTIIVAYGNITIIMSKGLEACWNIEGKLYCDYEYEANPYYTSVLAAEQINKIQESGYIIQLP